MNAEGVSLWSDGLGDCERQCRRSHYVEADSHPDKPSASVWAADTHYGELGGCADPPTPCEAACLLSGKQNNQLTFSAKWCGVVSCLLGWLLGRRSDGISVRGDPPITDQNTESFFIQDHEIVVNE